MSVEITNEMLEGFREWFDRWAPDVYIQDEAAREFGVALARFMHELLLKFFMKLPQS